MVVVLAILALVGRAGAGARPAAERRRRDARRPRPRSPARCGWRASRAIASNRPVPVRFDPAASSLQVGADAVRRLPAGIGIAAAPTILFRPDGSSSGGTVELASGSRTARIGVNWLTGRVVVADAR